MLVAALAGAWTWQFIDYRSHVREHRGEHRRFGEALLGGVEGAMLRECRGGRFDPDELAATFDEMRSRLDLSWVALVGPQGTVLAQAGTRQSAAATDDVHRKPFDPPRPRGAGRGRGGGASLRALPLGLELVLHLPGDALADKLADDLRRFLLTGVSLSIAVALLFGLLAARIRSLALESSLAASREQLKSYEFLGRLSAGLAHETRNPLGVVRGFAQRLADGAAEPEDVRRVARTILDETDRTLTRLDEFLLLSRPAHLKRTRFGLKALLQELAGLLHPDLEAKQASVAIEGAEVEIEADREQARRLFLNLLLNAVQALEGGGRIELKWRETADMLEIRIEDDGRGVPEEIRATLFEPYVSAREGGTGLGLAIARRIASEHLWRLEAAPRAGGGTAMIVEIPRS